MAQIPSIVVGKTGWLRTVIVIVLTLLASFNRELGSRVAVVWGGFSSWFAVVPVGLLVLYELLKANYAAFQKAEENNAVLEARLQPRLQIVFDPNKYLACLQEERWIDSGTTVIQRLFRVGLVNMSESVTIDDVEAFLSDLEGLDRPQHTAFLPVPLLKMGDIPGVIRPQQDLFFRLNPGPTPSVFLGIAWKRSAGNGSEHIQLQYAGGQTNLLDPSNRYRLKIMVKSRNAPQVEASFLMYVDANGVLQFDQASPSRPVS